MNTDFARLLGLHHLASASGQGLRPEFLALLQQYHTARGPTVVPLGAVPVSSGPDRAISDADLVANGVLRFPTPASKLRDITHV